MRRLAIGFAALSLTALLIGIGWYLSLGGPRPPRAVSPGALHVVVFGDSLGFGWGTARPERDGFVPQIFEKLVLERPGSVLLNLSKPGLRIADVTRVVSRYRGDADLIMIVAGGNDVRAVASPYRVARDEGALLAVVSQRFPRAATIVTDIPDSSLRREVPSFARWPFAALFAIDNAALRRAARANGANVLDLYTLSHRPDANALTAVSKDGLHPSEAGYRELAQALWPGVERILRPAR